ncbi:MAG: germination protein YpeB [Clostridia bacterium]|nr:germination protein YpeB [Clostridia bacterium]
MRKTIGKTYAFITAIVALGVLAITLIIGCVVIESEGARSHRIMQNSYKRAFYEMSDGASNIEVNLSKLAVSPARSETIPLLTNLSAQSALAENSLSQLPLDYHEAQNTSKFFNQVGDWSRSYSRDIALGKDLAPYENQAEILYEQARKLNRNIAKIMPNIEKGIYDIGKNTLAPNGYNFSFEGEQTRFVEYPKLIYDGPFSDEKPGVKGGVRAIKISQAQAKNIAEKTLKLTDITVLGKSGDDIVCYQMSGNVYGRFAYASICAHDGSVVNFDISYQPDEPKLNKSQAIKIATAKAKELGFEKVSAVWYNEQGGTAYVNLAPKIDGVVYYPDLIKVKVALDDGLVTGVESKSYAKNHIRRHLSPRIDSETAKANVSNKLTINAVTLALIPDGESNEKLCYEFACERDGLDYFVYIDAQSGVTRQILRVVNNDQGSLIM